MFSKFFSGRHLRYLIPLLLGSIAFILIKQHTMDIDPFDETLYILNGYIWQNPEWSPIYSNAYRFLTLFNGTPQFTYDSMRFLVCAVMLPLSLYCFNVSTGSTQVWAAASGLLASISLGSFATTPYIHQFNFSCLLFLYVLHQRLQTIRWSWIFYFLLGAMLFSRQENLFIVITCGLGWPLLAAIKGDWRAKKKSALEVGAMLIAVLTCYLGFGSPVGNRGFLAFKDHYLWHQERLDLKFENQLTTVNSLTEFITASPKDFFRHVLHNLIEIPFLTFNTVSLSRVPGLSEMGFFVYGFLLILLLAWLLYLRPQTFSTKKEVPWKAIYFGCCLFLQSVAVAFIFSAWKRYLLVAGFIGVYFLIPWLIRARCKSKEVSIKFKVCLTALCGLVLGSYIWMDKDYTTFFKQNRDAAKALRDSKVLRPNDRLLMTTAWGVHSMETLEQTKNLVFIGSSIKFPANNLEDVFRSKRVSLFCYRVNGPDLTFRKETDFINQVNALTKKSKLSGQFFEIPLGNSFINCLRFNGTEGPQ